MSKVHLNFPFCMLYNETSLRWGEAILQLIVRKRLAQTNAGQFELECFLTGDKKTGYGVKLIEYCDETVRCSCLVRNVSRSRSEALEMCELCVQEEVSPIHLPDVVKDFRLQRSLQCLSRTELCFA